MHAGAPDYAIREVAAEAVRPLRHAHLRPNRPASSVAYRTDEDETARHFAAYDATGRLVGIGSMHFEDRVAGQPPFGHPGMRIRGVAVEDDWRGRGVGAAIIEQMLSIAREAAIAEAWANARAENLGFFSRTGFREVSGEFEIPGIGAHRVMAQTLADKARRARRKREAGEAAGEDAGDAAGEAAAPGDEPLAG